jgi:hypothetical protein
VSAADADPPAAWLQHLREHPRFAGAMEMPPPRRPARPSAAVVPAVAAGGTLLLCVPSTFCSGLAGFVSVVSGIVDGDLYEIALGAIFSLLALAGGSLVFAVVRLALRSAHAESQRGRVVRRPARVIRVQARTFVTDEVVLELEDTTVRVFAGPVGLLSRLHSGDAGVAHSIGYRLVEFDVLNGGRKAVPDDPGWNA